MAINVVDSGSPAAPSRWAGRGAVAGLLAGPLFIGVFTVVGLLRPGYSASSTFVSELSTGPGGCAQVGSFVVTGALLFAFGTSLRPGADLPEDSRAGSILLQLIGVALAGSGPFVTDPSALFSQHTVHGVVHGVLGAVVFSGAPAVCFVVHHRIRSHPGARSFARWTLATGVSLVLGVGVLKLGQQPGGELFAVKGLVQRCVLVGFLAWVFAVATRRYRSSTRRRPD